MKTSLVLLTWCSWYLRGTQRTQRRPKSCNDAPRTRGYSLTQSEYASMLECNLNISGARCCETLEKHHLIKACNIRMGLTLTLTQRHYYSKRVEIYLNLWSVFCLRWYISQWGQFSWDLTNLSTKPCSQSLKGELSILVFNGTSSLEADWRFILVDCGYCRSCADLTWDWDLLVLTLTWRVEKSLHAKQTMQGIKIWKIPYITFILVMGDLTDHDLQTWDTRPHCVQTRDHPWRSLHQRWAEQISALQTFFARANVALHLKPHWCQFRRRKENSTIVVWPHCS